MCLHGSSIASLMGCLWEHVAEVTTEALPMIQSRPADLRLMLAGMTKAVNMTVQSSLLWDAAHKQFCLRSVGAHSAGWWTCAHALEQICMLSGMSFIQSMSSAVLLGCGMLS